MIRYARYRRRKLLTVNPVVSTVLAIVGGVGGLLIGWFIVCIVTGHDPTGIFE